MTPSELMALLSQPESPNLEFKRKLHEIYHPDPKVKEFQRNELIRDILALANNNTTTAGEPAYLVIGADDELIDNTRAVFGFEGQPPLPREILDTVNPASDPPLSNLTIETVEVSGKRLLVFTIAADPYLRETRRQLRTGERTSYSEHVVFIRHNESVQIASARERAAIQELRKNRLSERNVPLEVFGFFLGGIIGGSASARIVEETMPNLKHGKALGGITGMVVFGGLGAVLGDAFKTLGNIRFAWSHLKTIQRIAAIIYASTIPIAGILLFIGNPIRKNVK